MHGIQLKKGDDHERRHRIRAGDGRGRHHCAGDLHGGQEISHCQSAAWHPHKVCQFSAAMGGCPGPDGATDRSPDVPWHASPQ